MTKRFSAIYKPTSLFSLKTSNSTNSGAKSLFIPSPYSIKMAILNAAITLGKEDFESKQNNFSILRDVQIFYSLQGFFCVNNCFVKILKKERTENISEDKGNFLKRTVSFREYLHITNNIEIIFETKELGDSDYLKKYLHKINYFGKRGCFFQFIKYSDTPNEPNVKIFDSKTIETGILQEYDDFHDKTTFDAVNNFSSAKVKRKKLIFILPLKNVGSSKSFSNYQVIENAK